MYKFIFLALLALPSLTHAQSFSVVSNLDLTTAAKQYSITAKCGSGVCIDLPNNCSLSTVYTRQITTGISGIDVVALQDFLVKQGLLNMPKKTAYGTFGPITSTALRAYQRIHGLNQTGIVDETTRGYLNDLIIKGSSCHTYYRADQMNISISKNASLKQLVQDLNTNGYTSATGKQFCTVATGSCTLVSSTKPLIVYVPQRLGIVRSITYFTSQPGNFSAVSYVPAMKKDIQFKDEDRIVYQTSSSTVSTSQTYMPTSYTYSFTIPGNSSAATEAQEINALLSIGLTNFDSKIYGTWSLSKVANIAYNKDADGEILLVLESSPNQSIMTGCGTISGVLQGTIGVMRLTQVERQFQQCPSQTRALQEGELSITLSQGVRVKAFDTKLLITTAKGVIFEFARQ